MLVEMEREGVLEAYALGGAVAATFYLEPVVTVDVDVFVRLPNEEEIADPTPLFAFVRERGGTLEGEYAVIGGWPVQFLGPPGALGAEALERAVTVEADGVSVRVLGAEHLAAIALQTGRAKDKARLLMFLQSDNFDRITFIDIAERHQLAPAWSAFKAEFGVS